jgi:hypothetical protein
VEPKGEIKAPPILGAFLLGGMPMGEWGGLCWCFWAIFSADVLGKVAGEENGETSQSIKMDLGILDRRERIVYPIATSL